jgi:arylsulfatase A-like enzyme
VYGEVTEVPFVISFPFRLEPGLVIDSRTENVDVWPTVLDLLGLPSLPQSDGSSLVPLIRAAAQDQAPPPDGTHHFAQIDQTWGRSDRPPSPMVAVTSGSFRYVLSTGAQPAEELFDHERDAREVVDVLGTHPEIGAELRAVARTYLDARPPWGGQAPTVEIDEMEQNQLRALGYAVP